MTSAEVARRSRELVYYVGVRLARKDARAMESVVFNITQAPAH